MVNSGHVTKLELHHSIRHSSAGARFLLVGARMVGRGHRRAREREPIMEVWLWSPQLGLGAEPPCWGQRGEAPEAESFIP